MYLRRYGVIDPADAERFGYAWPASPNESAPAGLSPHANAGFYGTPGPSVSVEWVDGTAIGDVTMAGGCLGSAYRDLFGSDDAALRYQASQKLVEHLRRDATKSAQQSDAWRALDKEWWACMAAAGVDALATPPEMVGADWGRAKSSEPTAQERIAAVADVECKRSVDYVDTAEALLRDAELRIEVAHPEVAARLAEIEGELASA